MFDNMQAEVQQTSNSTIASKIASLLLYYGLLISTNPGCICFVFRTGKILLGIPNVHRGSELAELHLSQVVMVQQLTSWHPEVVSSLQQRIIPRQPNKTCPSFGVSFGSLKMGWLEKKKSQILSCSRGSFVSTASMFLSFRRTIEQRQWTGGKGSSHGVSSHGPGSVCNFWQIEGERDFDLRFIYIIFSPMSWK